MKWFGIALYGLASLATIALGIAVAYYALYLFSYFLVVSTFG
jgi:hypothetical protein